jgi:putative addiction module component (TIGR02574 family)
VQDHWDRNATEAEPLPLSPAQVAELDRRLADYGTQPEESIPWEVAREKMRKSE